MTGRLPKPPHGAPCNRCGWCCEDQLCPLGDRVFGARPGPCPALSYDGNLSVCGLVAAPAKFVRVRAAMVGPTELAKAAMILIGSGKGCDAPTVGEAPDWAFRAQMIAWVQAHGAEIDAARKAWGIGRASR